jgi:hypothetical protein
MKSSICIALFASLLAPAGGAVAQSGFAMTCVPSAASQQGSLQMQAKTFLVDFAAPSVTRSDDPAPLRDIAVSNEVLSFSDFVAGVGNVHWQIDRRNGSFRAQISLIPANVRPDPVFFGQCSGVAAGTAVGPPGSASSTGARPAAAM